MRIKNPEILEDLYAKKRSVLLVSGHYNNWEWLITSQNFLLPHQAVGIGIPLTSKFWDKKINDRRSRFGMIILHSRNVREFFADTKDTTATLVLGDQASGDTRKAYWMKFLNQDTGVQFGCEMLAHTYDQAVVFFITRKIKRGHYEIEFTPICENPHEMNYGEITEKQTHLLEKEIMAHPEFWMRNKFFLLCAIVNLFSCGNSKKITSEIPTIHQTQIFQVAPDSVHARGIQVIGNEIFTANNN
eukprot:gene26066-47267_t